MDKFAKQFFIIYSFYNQYTGAMHIERIIHETHVGLMDDPINVHGTSVLIAEKNKREKIALQIYP